MTIAMRRSAFLIIATLAVLIALPSYRYLVPGAPGGTSSVLANAFTRFGALTIHAGFAATALLIGPLQFVQTLRRTRPALHRWIGRTYVACCLVAGAAGFFLAMGTTAGPVASLGFGSLAVIWFVCTFQAWRLARARDFARHQRWMIRSYALTLAAVTLRIYLPLAMMLKLDFAIAYPAISFLCWIPNIAIAELLLAGGVARQAVASKA